MNAGIGKQRSPNAPGVPLEDAITVAGKLYNALRNASVKPDVAAKALGYSGLNGAALTTLGMLSQYGLIDRSKGSVTISPLAMNILHPISQSQKDDAIRTAALSPRVFEELNQSFRDCSPGVIENHLIHHEFSPERAKKVGAVYAANRAFANLQNQSNVAGTENRPPNMPLTSDDIRTRNPAAPPQPFDLNVDLSHVRTENVLPLAREYRLPLDERHEVEVRFFGDSAGAEQFAALSELLTFMRSRFKTAPSQPGKLADKPKSNVEEEEK
jgi:hypothetical protein